MLRRNARLRREYFYQKSEEDRQRKDKSRREKLEKNIIRNNFIHSGVQCDAVELLQSFKYSTNDNFADVVDDEYRYAGLIDPKVVITTSHEPSARLKMFIKELRLVIPHSQRMNRGKYELKEIIQACRANDVTDLIIIHEHRGVPDNLIVCHMPYGPSVFFNILNVVMRHDIPNIGPVSEQKPHLIFHNFKTILGQRVMQILKHIFPVAKVGSKRVITFANHDDFISFRHHTYNYINKELELSEVGPRFELKLYQIKLGTLDEINAADTEWILRPYMNTSAKRRFLSNDDGWNEGDV